MFLWCWSCLRRSQLTESNIVSVLDLIKLLDTIVNTVEPRFNDLRYNDILGITINNRLPSKSYSKMYGVEPRYNDLRYNDIPG